MAPKQKTSHWLNAGSIETSLTILSLLFGFRLINAYYVQTFFQPDEYFQALEPGWELAFGQNAGAWITWEWREGLRTSVHPVLFAAVYKAADWTCSALRLPDSARANALVAAPRLLQACWAASMDHLTWRTAVKLYGPAHPASSAALVLTVLSPWQWHCSVRTFSNSLEATLTAAAVWLFPWSWFLEPEEGGKAPSSFVSFANVFSLQATASAPSGLHPALAAAAMAFYFRPTNLIIWVAITLGLIFCNRNYRKAAVLLQAAIIIGCGVVAAFACVDRLYYGEWTFAPLRFVYFNFVQSLAVFYGTNRHDYYFTEGLPLLLITALPFAAIGVWEGLRSSQIRDVSQSTERQTRFVFSLAAVVTTLAFSAIAHKEVRFLYPLLPVLHILAAKHFASFFRPFPVPRSTIRKLLLAFVVATNLYIAGYVSMTHQRGVVDVMHYLRHRQESWFSINPISGDWKHYELRNISVGFLMPCHSTPWRSHFVYPEVDAWALTCEPPIHLPLEDRATYLDEADVFYADPKLWLEQNMKDVKTMSIDVDPDVRVEIDKHDTAHRKWPHYLIFFEHLEPTVKSILVDTRYKECKRFFNTHWHDDGRRKGDVIVWCMRR